MHKNPLFRGCTRPPMFMGVPYIPFFMGAGGCFLLAVYTNFFYLLLLPVVIFIMRQMARRDEMIFRLHGPAPAVPDARYETSAINDGMWVFTPHSHRGQGREKS